MMSYRERSRGGRVLLQTSRTRIWMVPPPRAACTVLVFVAHEAISLLGGRSKPHNQTGPRDESSTGWAVGCDGRQ